jgi:hypothetical protein
LHVSHLHHTAGKSIFHQKNSTAKSLCKSTSFPMFVFVKIKENLHHSYIGSRFPEVIRCKRNTIQSFDVAREIEREERKNRDVKRRKFTLSNEKFITEFSS